MLIPRSLIHLRNSVQMYSKVLDYLKQIVIYREISLSVVSNMSNCIIEFGIPELW